MKVNLRQLATDLHNSANTKYGDKPTSYHLKQVEKVLLNHDIYDEDLLLAAWFHDVLEDVPEITTNYLLDQGLSKKTVHLVSLVTDPMGSNRSERKEALYQQLKEHEEAITIKLADRIANLSEGIDTGNKDFLNMYLDEHEEFTKNLFHPQFSLNADLWTTYHKKISSARDVVSS